LPICLIARVAAFLANRELGGIARVGERALRRAGLRIQAHPNGADLPDRTARRLNRPYRRAVKQFFLNSLTEKQNYGIVTYRWTKGASHADGKRPFPPRMAKTKG
jgi:hypothetical protein